MTYPIISQQARQAILVGRQHHWRFKVVGQGEPPSQPVYKDEWWFETVHTIPEKGKDRLEALQRARVPFKSMIIAHEAPKLLTAPKEMPKKQESKSSTTPILPAVEAIAVGIVTILLLVFGLMFRAVLLDPALIVVLEDGTWVEVMTWYE
jgi:hypothetical protein